jgi:DNA sulfur modification protein DndE
MLDLTLRNIPFTAESDIRLRTLKARVGLDRNYLCRMGFCLSLEEPGIPVIPEQSVKASREIERYTLLGHNSRTYLALLLVWMNDHGIDFVRTGAIDEYFVAHMNRGLEIMTSRVRSLVDMASLPPVSQSSSTSLEGENGRGQGRSS